MKRLWQTLIPSCTFTRRIIAMRKENLIMPYGEVELVWPEDKQVFAYFKRLEGETWLVRR